MMRAMILGLALVVGQPVIGAETAEDNEASVARGAQLYRQFCTECHGADGRAQVDVISDATDLTQPELYYSGTSRDDIFNSIRNGAGVGMPPWSMQIPEEASTWDLVNFIRSLWSEADRASH